MRILKVGALLRVVIMAIVLLAFSEGLHHLYATPSIQEAAEGYAQRHIFDPIYAFPGVDISSLEYSLDAFVISAHAAVPQFPEDPEAKETIYPMRFLAEVSETERSRREFLTEPTQQTALIYHTKLLRLLAAHEADLKRADELLSKSTDSNTYRFLSGETTAAKVKNVLQAARTANKAAREKEERRFSCFEGKTRACEPIALLRLQFGKIYPRTISAPVPKVAEYNREALTVLYPSATSSTLYTLNTPSCVPENSAFYALAIEPSRLSGIKTVQPLYLNTLYVESTASSTHPFYRLLKDSGTQLTYQPISAYLCPDYGKDVGTLLGMYTLSKSPLLGELAHSSFQTSAMRELTRTANVFVSASVLKESDYHAVLSAASRVIRTENSNSTAIRLSDFVTEARAHSSRLDLVVGYFDDLQVGSYIPYRLNPTPPSVFLITRGGLSQLYALNNETVFPEAQSLMSKLAYTTDPFGDTEIPIKPLTEVLLYQAGFSSPQQMLAADVLGRQKAFSDFISELLSARNRVRSR